MHGTRASDLTRSAYRTIAAAVVPAISGMQLEQLVDEALGKKQRSAGDPLVDIDIDGDNVKVWLE